MASVNLSAARLLTLCSIRSASSGRGSAFVKSRSSSLGYVTNNSKAFGVKSSSFCVSAMSVYKVKLLGPNGEENEFEVPDGVHILEPAEGAGLKLPYLCRSGACSTCTGLLVWESADQSEAVILNETQMEQGYVVTCVSYPTSDCVIHTHKEGDLYLLKIYNQ